MTVSVSKKAGQCLQTWSCPTEKKRLLANRANPKATGSTRLLCSGSVARKNDLTLLDSILTGVNAK
jgi:hypothetical protein